MYYDDYGYRATQSDIDEIVRIKKKIINEGWNTLTLSEQEHYLGLDNAREHGVTINNNQPIYHVNGCLNVYDLNRWSWYLGKVGHYFNDNVSALRDSASANGVDLTAMLCTPFISIKAGYVWVDDDSALSYEFNINNPPLRYDTDYGLQDLSHDLMMLMTIRNILPHGRRFDIDHEFLFEHLDIETINCIEECMSGEHSVDVIEDDDLFDVVHTRILRCKETFERAGEFNA